jgi:hypothetical protein
MSTTPTPNMGLPVPNVLSEVGPAYAQDVNDCMTIVDDHDHTGGGTGGKRLGAAALNLDADLPVNGHNLTSVRAERFNDSTTATGSDLRTLYVTGGNLYYNNNAATPVQITNGSALNGVISNILSGIAISSNRTIQASDPYTLYQVDTTSAGVTITLPTAVSVGRGRWYVVVDQNFHASTHNIVIQRSSSDTVNNATSVTIVDNGGGALVFSDGISIWTAQLTHAGNATYATTTATTANITTANITTDNVTTLIAGSVAAGGGTVASAGSIRLNSTGTVNARNNANSADLTLLTTNSSDTLLVGDTTNTANCTVQCKSGGTLLLQSSTGGSVTLVAGCTIGGNAFTAQTSSAAQMNVSSGGEFKCTTTTATMGFNSANKLSCNTTGLGLYTTAPVAQAARAGQITDNTGGSATTTFAAITAGASYAQADMVACKNALASIAAQYNKIETALHNIGLTA